MTSLRTRTWPSARSTRRALDELEVVGGGPADGAALELDLTGVGHRVSLGVRGFGIVGVRRGRAGCASVDDDLDRDVAARRVGVGAHLVRGVDELAAELRVDALGQLDVQDDAETEAGARRSGEADVGGDRDVEVLDPALARDEAESAREARGIPGGEELLRVGALAAAAELARGGERDVEPAVGGDGAALAARRRWPRRRTGRSGWWCSSGSSCCWQLNCAQFDSTLGS